MMRLLGMILLVSSMQIGLAQSNKASTDMDQAKPYLSQTTAVNHYREAEDQQQRALAYASLLVLASAGGCAVLFSRNRRLQRQLSGLEGIIQRQQHQLAQTQSILNATQTQLEQAEKMASLGELTAGIAHEIQNPLNFVNNFSDVSAELVTELIEAQQKTERDVHSESDILSDIKQNLEKISHHGKRAASIIRSMLEHARSTPGERQLTDINALTDEYLRLSYHGLRAKEKEFSCQLVTHFAPDLVKIPVIMQDIGRVLLNVFNNAFYAVDARRKQLAEGHQGKYYQPTVTVQTFWEKEQVVICVRDNGTGIAEAVKDKIFQSFFTTKPTGEGTGLGLSLSYATVTKDHGGSLTVESQEGEGTAFEIRLPVAG